MAENRLVVADRLVKLYTLVGVALGVLAARAVASRFGFPFVMRVDMAVLAFAFSALVGIVFGLYPARKAARLDPIDALRYE